MEGLLHACACKAQHSATCMYYALNLSWEEHVQDVFVHIQHRTTTVKIHDEDAEIYFKNPTYEGSSGQNGVPVGMYDVIRTPYQRVEGNGHTYETLDNQQAQRKYTLYSPAL